MIGLHSILKHTPRPLPQPLQQTITFIYHVGTSPDGLDQNLPRVKDSDQPRIVVYEWRRLCERAFITAPYFSSAEEYASVFSPSPFWRWAEATYSAEEQRVWFGHTGGSPSSSFPIFSQAKREKNSLTRATEEPLDSGNDAALHLSHRGVASHRVSVCFAWENHL